MAQALRMTANTQRANYDHRSFSWGDGQPSRQEIAAGAGAGCSGTQNLFDLAVRLKGPASDGRYNGEFVRTAVGRRYIYVAWGKLAGQPESCWERRAKIMLESLDPAMADAALKEGKRLEARINGRARDGSPACARVPVEWRVI